MYSQYAGVGTQCPLFSVVVETGGNLSTSGTIYLSFQLQNRSGYNIPSVSSAITYSAGDKIKVTIPDTVRQPGWDIFYYIISAGSTSDPSTHVQIARYPNYSFGIGVEPQTVESPLPFTVELTEDEHLLLAPSVPASADLPITAFRLDGQIRWVTDEAKFFEYRADSNIEINSNVIVADVGQWVRVGNTSAYVDDTRNGQGSDRLVVQINPATIISNPPYAADKSLPGWSIKYWLYNNDDQSLPAGTEYGIEPQYGGVVSPDLLSGLIMMAFLGYVQSDGTIRNQDGDGNLFDVGSYIPWTPRIASPFITPDDLQPGEAIAIGIKPFFSDADFNQGIEPGSFIGIKPITRSQSGDYNPLGKLIPYGVVYPAGDFYRVVPGSGLSYFVLSGHALVASYDFPIKPKQTYGGLQPDTVGQKIVINGNASVFTEPPNYQIHSVEALRAIVGTAEGESKSGEWSEPVVSTSGQGMEVTVAYNEVIRADYPDIIKGNTKAAFNPLGVRIYIQRMDTLEVRRFIGFLIVAINALQVFSVPKWTDGEIVSLPSPDADFSLFAPGETAIAVGGAGVFPVGTSFRATYSYYYDGNQITSISHESPPCIPEFSGNFVNIFDSNVYLESQEDSFLNSLIFG